MSRQKPKTANVYRIYTEDRRRKRVIAAAAKFFDNFTLQPTNGFYQGKLERSIVLEVAGAQRKDVEKLASRIRAINKQKSILILHLKAKSERIPAKQ